MPGFEPKTMLRRVIKTASLFAPNVRGGHLIALRRELLDHRPADVEKRPELGDFVYPLF